MRCHDTCLVAGIDPTWNEIPWAVKEQARKQAATPIEMVRLTLTLLYRPIIEDLVPFVAAFKPNIAFFEALGLGGLAALSELISDARLRGVPVLLDAKRGDIGSTAEAYAHAYLNPQSLDGLYPKDFEVDAITYSPYLGYPSIEPLVSACRERGKGLFLLVRTSNPRSDELQGKMRFPSSQGSLNSSDYYHSNPCETVCAWIEKLSLEDEGEWTPWGLVVGASLEDEARLLRSLLPRSLFLVPGYGAQGATFAQARAGATSSNEGVLINSSRALFGGISKLSLQEARELIRSRASSICSEFRQQ
jgi:orotidine-5'-phosphate decarboxylase